MTLPGPRVSPPLLSIVIPTHGRPVLLRRAIESALACGRFLEVEVLVVPNGPDDSWKAVLAAYPDNLVVSPISTAHACAARNHGMARAQGKYIRFLDDDDELYPDVVAMQVRELDQTNAGLCSAGIELADDEGRVYGEWMQDKETSDFVEALCSLRTARQITGHVFRRDQVSDVPWDESLPYSQDISWFLDLISVREFVWVKVDRHCGCWHKHVGRRISVGSSIHHRRMLIAERLRSLAVTLESQGRLTSLRQAAIATGIWEQVHDALYLSPRYWWGQGKWASAFCPGSRPSKQFFVPGILRRLVVNPLVWEAVTCPRSMANHAVKYLGYKLGLARKW